MKFVEIRFLICIALLVFASCSEAPDQVTREVSRLEPSDYYGESDNRISKYRRSPEYALGECLIINWAHNNRAALIGETARTNSVEQVASVCGPELAEYQVFCVEKYDASSEGEIVKCVSDMFFEVRKVLRDNLDLPGDVSIN